MGAHHYLNPHILGVNQLAKIIYQQIAIKFKLLDKNMPLYCRYKPGLVLESANRTLYLDRSILTDKTVDFNRPHQQRE